MENFLKWTVYSFLFILALPILAILAGILLAVICALLVIVFVIGLAILPFAVVWYLAKKCSFANYLN